MDCSHCFRGPAHHLYQNAHHHDQIGVCKSATIPRHTFLLFLIPSQHAFEGRNASAHYTFLSNLVSHVSPDTESSCTERNRRPEPDPVSIQAKKQWSLRALN